MTDRELQTLTPQECITHLEDGHIGRLAFIDKVGVLPMVTPVNYVFDNDRVVFRTDPGSKLNAAVLGAPVAFEVDGVDERTKTGWSVVVRGHAEEVADAGEMTDPGRAALLPWASGDKAHYVRVQPRQMSGRKISLADVPSNWWG